MPLARGAGAGAGACAGTGAHVSSTGLAVPSLRLGAGCGNATWSRRAIGVGTEEPAVDSCTGFCGKHDLVAEPLQLTKLDRGGSGCVFCPMATSEVRHAGPPRTVAGKRPAGAGWPESGAGGSVVAVHRFLPLPQAPPPRRPSLPFPFADAAASGAFDLQDVMP